MSDLSKEEHIRVIALTEAIKITTPVADLDTVAMAQQFADFIAGTDNKAQPPVEEPKKEEPKATKSRKAKPEPEKSAPAEEPAPEEEDDFLNEAAVKEEPKYTLDNVRAALVEVQSKLGGKDHAIKVLKQFSSTGVLSGLKEADYGKLIAAAAEAIKAAKK